jgi:hypothetical protein
MNNTNALFDFLSNQNNLNTISVVQQGVSLLVGLLIFVKSYDFQSFFASVRKRREEARREKERKKLEKIKRLMEMAKNGDALDISKLAMSNEEEDDDDDSEVKSEKGVMKTTRKKRKEIV